MTTTAATIMPVFFGDRRDAGRRLATIFGRDDGDAATVLGLARGGVVTAAEVARALEAPLEAIAVRKICHPWYPDLTIGAVAPGEVVNLPEAHDLTEGQVAHATALAEEALVALDELLHLGDPPLDLRGRKAILVDDGIETGATMVAAVRWVRARGAEQVVVATPVTSVEGLRLVLQVADQTLTLHTLSGLSSVRHWYGSYGYVDIDTMLELIRLSRGETQQEQAPVNASGVQLSRC